MSGKTSSQGFLDNSPSTAAAPMPFPPRILKHLKYVAAALYEDSDGRDISCDAKKALEWIKSRQACAQQARSATLTDEQIDAVTDAQWGKGCAPNQYQAHRAYARAIIRAFGGAEK